LVVLGLSLPLSEVSAVTVGFLGLKRRFFPGLFVSSGPFLDSVLVEVKGADIRRSAASAGRRTWRPALQFLGAVFELLERHEATVLGRIWIKDPSKPMRPRAVYTSSIQALCTVFQAQLEEEGDVGFVIADSRRKGQNARVAHSIFTQKYKREGDPWSRIVEMPTFGHSENHVGLQLADLLASAVVFPLAVESYCKPHVRSVHTQRDYSRLKSRFGLRLKRLQFRYQDRNGRWRGGLTVSDPLRRRPSSRLFC
jgi:hypothetical protein